MYVRVCIPCIPFCIMLFSFESVGVHILIDKMISIISELISATVLWLPTQDQNEIEDEQSKQKEKKNKPNQQQ